MRVPLAEYLDVLVGAAGHSRVDHQRLELPIRSRAVGFQQRDEDGLLQVDQVRQGVLHTQGRRMSGNQSGELLGAGQVSVVQHPIDQTFSRVQRLTLTGHLRIRWRWLR